MIDPTARILADLTRLSEHHATPDYQRQWQIRNYDLLIEQSRAAIAVEARHIVEYEARKKALCEGRDK